MPALGLASGFCYNYEMINRVIKLLIFSDFIINFAFSLLSPIFAVFLLQKIEGSTLEVVGLATTFYWLARILTTVPLSKFMDKTDGERDEFYFVIIGTFVMSSVPLIYLLINQPIHLYIVQFIYGIAGSMAVPAWRILFTDHLDRGKTGFEWSLEDVAIGSSTAIAAYVGSVMAQRFGFTAVLVVLSILGYLSTLMLIPIYQKAKTLAQLKKEMHLEELMKKRHQSQQPKQDKDSPLI